LLRWAQRIRVAVRLNRSFEHSNVPATGDTVVTKPARSDTTAGAGPPGVAGTACTCRYLLPMYVKRGDQVSSASPPRRVYVNQTGPPPIDCWLTFPSRPSISPGVMRTDDPAGPRTVTCGTIEQFWPVS
jgi:hypothetical protein